MKIRHDSPFQLELSQLAFFVPAESFWHYYFTAILYWSGIFISIYFDSSAISQLHLWKKNTIVVAEVTVDNTKMKEAFYLDHISDL